MNRYATALFSSILSIALLAGCGSATNAPAPQSTPPIAKPDVMITIDGVQRACVVALNNEPYGNTIPCTDVIAFVHNELRVPSGAVYELRTTGTVDPAEVQKVRTGLNDAGYRSTQSGR